MKYYSCVSGEIKE